jgi:transcriptional regulator with XRE-family HTH domain
MSRSSRAALGLRLRAERKARNLSQAEFSARCGMHRNYLSSVERGERNIGFDNLCRFADALGITLSDLLSDIGK